MIKGELLSFIQRKVLDIIQVLKLAKKTSKDDYLTHLRLVLLAIGIVGGIAFVIKLIAEFLSFSGQESSNQMGTWISVNMPIPNLKNQPSLKDN